MGREPAILLLGGSVRIGPVIYLTLRCGCTQPAGTSPYARARSPRARTVAMTAFQGQEPGSGPAPDRRTFDSLNPATGQPSATFPLYSRADAEVAGQPGAGGGALVGGPQRDGTAEPAAGLEILPDPAHGRARRADARGDGQAGRRCHAGDRAGHPARRLGGPARPVIVRPDRRRPEADGQARHVAARAAGRRARP